VIAKSFARIHKANLVNFGILPLTFASDNDYKETALDDILTINDLKQSLLSGEQVIAVNTTSGKQIMLNHDLDKRDIDILIAGGLLNHTKQKMGK